MKLQTRKVWLLLTGQSADSAATALSIGITKPGKTRKDTMRVKYSKLMTPSESYVHHQVVTEINKSLTFTRSVFLQLSTMRSLLTVMDEQTPFKEKSLMLDPKASNSNGKTEMLPGPLKNGSTNLYHIDEQVLDADDCLPVT